MCNTFFLKVSRIIQYLFIIMQKQGFSSLSFPSRLLDFITVCASLPVKIKNLVTSPPITIILLETIIYRSTTSKKIHSNLNIWIRAWRASNLKKVLLPYKQRNQLGISDTIITEPRFCHVPLYLLLFTNMDILRKMAFKVHNLPALKDSFLRE